MVPLRKATGDIRQSTAAARDSIADAALAELSPASRANGSVMPNASVKLHAALLSGVAGYVDAAGFASLVGLFPAHLTGELVGDAIALSSGHLNGRAHLWAFPVFIGSVTLATLVARIFRHHGLKARAALLALVTLALALFSASDALAWTLHEGQLPLLFRGGFAVAAMGFQSALMRESLTGSCPTTVMTGNLTQVVIDVVDHVVGAITRPVLKREPSRLRLTPVASALLAFAFGAALGGWLARSYGSASVALPTAITAVLMIRAWREDVALGSRRNLAPAAVLNGEKAQPWPDIFIPASEDSARAESGPQCSDHGSETRLKVDPILPQKAERPAPRRRISGTQRIRR